MNIESRQQNGGSAPPEKASPQSGDFAMYYDEALTEITPYNATGEYFSRAKSRIDYTYGLFEDAVPNSSILDIGASPFYLLYRALEGGAKNCEGIFFSHDEHPIKDATKIYCQYGSIGLAHSNAEEDRLPFEDNSFDIVTACEILEHFDNFPSLLLREIGRILRPGGILCLTVPNVASATNIAKLILQKNIYSPYRPDSSGRHKHEYTYSQLKDLVKYMGFDLLRSGFLPFSTGRHAAVKSLYRGIHAIPMLKRYSPVLYVVARQPDPKPGIDANPPPQSIYRDALSIEV